MKEFLCFLVVSCQKPAKLWQLSGSMESFWEACSFETRLFLQPFLSQHCSGSHYCHDILKESCLYEEAWPDKNPGKFTELLTFPRCYSRGSNWLPLIRFPRCNLQLLIRRCHLLRMTTAQPSLGGQGQMQSLNLIFQRFFSCWGMWSRCNQPVWYYHRKFVFHAYLRSFSVCAALSVFFSPPILSHGQRRADL